MTAFSEHNLRVKMTQTLINSCNRCELGKTSNRVPFGGVTWRPKLILLGEAPGARENLLKEPFVGPAGLLLDDILKMVGLTRDHVMIANTVCCRPPQNRDPEWAEIMACKFNRDAQIRLGRTWVGVSMGRIALSTLLEEPGKAIGAYKGRPMWRGTKVWVPTYHPAYGLRNKNAIGEIASHIKMALDIYEGRKEAPQPSTNTYTLHRSVLVMDHEAVKVPDRVRELATATYTKGEWVRMMYSTMMAQGVVENVKTQFPEAEVVR